MTGGDALERYRGAFEGYRVDGRLDRRDDTDRLLATDLALERTVIIHVLAPETATPERRTRFRRVARLLAQLTHPNIVPVHRCDDGRPGLDYFIVPHLAGRTLADRLAGGPLSPEEGRRLAADLLDALQAAHAMGLAGGELEPGSIVCEDGRWVLTGLGTARAAGLTPYAAPEETGGGQGSAQADLYVAGLVLREALGPRAPRGVRPVLARALTGPDERWPDAAGFRVAMREAARGTPRRSLVVLLGLAAVAVVAVARALGGRDTPEPPLFQLALLPVVPGTQDPDTLARGLAALVQLDLDGVPGLQIAPQRRVLKLLAARGRGDPGLDVESVDPDILESLRAEWVARGRLDRQGSVLRLALTLYDRDGNKRLLPEVRGSADDLAELSDTLALRLLRAVAPQRVARYVPRPELQGVPLRALKAFLRGEEAFGRDEHSRAEAYYRDAVLADSSFALAAWRLANVRRWRRLPYDLDLRALRDRQGERLDPTDRGLLEALLEPDLRRRFAMLDSVVSTAPEDAYARLIYGEELWHRGPLVGVDVEEARRTMARAVAADSALAQAYDHIIMYYIREGRSDEAWGAYQLRARVSPRPSPGDPDYLRLFRLALWERFHPHLVRVRHWWLDFRPDSSDIAGLTRVARLGVPWFDIPEAEVALSRIVLHHGAATDSARGSARVGIALGYLAQGRVARGLAELDSAADALATDEMRLQQAEWRVIPPALGLRGWSPADARPWVARLERLAANPVLAPRARWALALARLGAQDTAAFVDRAAAPPDLPAGPLGVLLRAVRAGVLGRPRDALAMSDSVRLAFEVTQPPDPFAGAAFHLFRGAWQLAAGSPEAADHEWLWYQAADFEGWPSAHPQAGEVDGVLAAFARWKRAQLRLATSADAADTAAACALLRRSAESWKDADTSLGAAIAAGAVGCRS